MKRVGVYVILVGLAVAGVCSAEGETAAAGSSGSKRLFVMDALSAKLTRASQDATSATLELTGVSPTATWFTGEPPPILRSISCGSMIGDM